jgi:hypothetical protein
MVPSYTPLKSAAVSVLGDEPPPPSPHADSRRRDTDPARASHFECDSMPELSARRGSIVNDEVRARDDFRRESSMELDT